MLLSVKTIYQRTNEYQSSPLIRMICAGAKINSEIYQLLITTRKMSKSTYLSLDFTPLRRRHLIRCFISVYKLQRWTTRDVLTSNRIRGIEVRQRMWMVECTGEVSKGMFEVGWPLSMNGEGTVIKKEDWKNRDVWRDLCTISGTCEERANRPLN